MMNEPNLVRFTGAMLVILSRIDSGECEVCGEPVSIHEWVDMDRNGFIVDCSSNPEQD